MTEYPANFADYPVSLGEAKKDNDAATWTPREALINVLREIDNGEADPSALVVAWTEDNKGGGDPHVKFRIASPNGIVTQGLLTIVSRRCTEPTP